MLIGRERRVRGNFIPRESNDRATGEELQITFQTIRQLLIRNDAAGRPVGSSGGTEPGSSRASQAAYDPGIPVQ